VLKNAEKTDMNIHEEVRGNIASGTTCHVQIRIDGKIISLHPSFIGFWITYSGDIIGSEYDLHAVKSLMIDEWVQGDTDLA